MSPEYFLSLVSQISGGLKYTLGLFFITIILSVPMGLLLSLVRTSKYAPLRWSLGGYIWLMRGTPLLLQLFFIYYGLYFIPYIGPYLELGQFPAACVAFVLNYAAYFCEIFRGGLLGVNKGQHEAAKVLGFSNTQTFIRVIIPQMLRITLPSVTNEFITLVKDTSLITVIGISEILYRTKSAVNRDVNISAYLVVAVFYLIATFILTKLFKYLEKKLSY